MIVDILIHHLARHEPIEVRRTVLRNTSKQYFRHLKDYIEELKEDLIKKRKSFMKTHTKFTTKKNIEIKMTISGDPSMSQIINPDAS